MSKVKKFFKQNWITVWLVSAILAVGGFMIYASYTGMYVAKRVVSVKAGAGILFSSNRMDGYEDEGQYSTKHLTASSTGNFTYFLTVCDFAQNDPYTRYGSNIPYQLSAQLCVKPTGAETPRPITSGDTTVIADLANKTFKIQFASKGGTDVSGSNAEFDLTDFSAGNNYGIYSNNALELTPEAVNNIGGSGTDKFKIIFDSSEFTNNQTYDYYIMVKAKPDPSLTRLENIACYLYASKVNIQTSAWTGTLQERGSFGDYDGYNFIIEGSGSDTIRLRWDPDVVDISGISLHDMGITSEMIHEYDSGEHSGWKYFDKYVDSSQGKSRYELQVFKVNGEINDSVIGDSIGLE